MATGAAFARFTNKKLAGFTDFGARMLDYFKELNRDSVQARFDVDGVFNTLHGLTGDVDTVTITGSSRSTDGLGHIMRVSSALGGVSALFENEDTIEYHVGLRYAEIPISVVVNPRTGLPEYAAFQEEVGEPGVPNSVTDNGSTITFNVNNVTEAGVTNAGRTVRVYKLIPAEGATTEAIAIEDCEVTFDGTNNEIETAGVLGQSVVSTTAADYVIVLLGPTVKRSTNLITSPNHCFIGTVTGVGAGDTPTVFSTTDQRLLRTFSDASQVLFTPYSWISGTTVDAAFHDVVDVLGDAGTSNPGAVRIGTNPVALTKAKPTIFAEGAGGIGTVADGTFPTVKDLQTVLVAINAALDRHRGWTKSFGGSRGTAFGTSTGSVLRVDGVGDTAWEGGTWFLQGISGYTLRGASAMSSSVGPYVLGEASGGQDGEDRTAILLDTNTSANEILSGKWQRLDFKQDGSTTGGLRVGRSCILENITAEPGLIRIDDMDSAGANGLSATQLSIQGTTHRDFGGSLQVGTQSQNGVYFGTVRNSRIASAPSGTHGAVLWLLHDAGTAIDHPNQKKLVFECCSFVAMDDIPLISDTGSTDPIIADMVFDSCTFRTDDTPAAVASAFFDMTRTARVCFRNCTFVDRFAAGFKNTSAIFENCRFIIGAVSAPDDRKLIDFDDCKLVDCEFVFHNIGQGAFDMVEITNSRLSNCRFTLSVADSLLPDGARGFDFEDCQISNLTVDLNGAVIGSNSSSHGVVFTDCRGSNVEILRAPNGRTGGDNPDGNILLFSLCEMSNISVESLAANKADDVRSLARFAGGIYSVLNFNRGAAGNRWADAGLMLVGSDSGGAGTLVSNLTISGSLRTAGSGPTLPGILLDDDRCKLSRCFYLETSGDEDDVMILTQGALHTLTDLALNGGNQNGTFGGFLIQVESDSTIISGSTFEWSSSANGAGFGAINVTATGDRCNVINNAFQKEIGTSGTGDDRFTVNVGALGTFDEDHNQYVEIP